MNLQDNCIIEGVHQVLANLVWTFELDKNYVDEDDPSENIPAAEYFYRLSTFHTTNKNAYAQLVLGWDMIVPI